MNNQEITHKDEGGKESFKFTQRGYMWLNPETLKWSYCNPAFSLRSLADVKRIVELESLLKKFRPMDENGDGWDFVYNEGSEYLGAAVLEALRVGV
jgi:hypothetical protein